MKKTIIKSITALMLVFVGLTKAHALLANGEVEAFTDCNERSGRMLMTSKTCRTLALFMITTSPPSFIVDGEKMDFKSTEASERLVAEAYGDADPVVSSALAQLLEVKTENIQEVVFALIQEGKNVSAQAVTEKLLQK